MTKLPRRHRIATGSACWLAVFLLIAITGNLIDGVLDAGRAERLRDPITFEI